MSTLTECADFVRRMENPVKEIQIPFVESLIPAVLSGQKTNTRRVIKPQPEVTEKRLRETGGWVEGKTLSQLVNEAWQAGFIPVECPYGRPGDRATVPGVVGLSLEIVSIRIELLQDISVEDAIAEGVSADQCIRGDDDIIIVSVMSALDAQKGYFMSTPAPIARFVLLWDRINGVYPKNWNANPWVWVVEFKKVAA